MQENAENLGWKQTLQTKNPKGVILGAKLMSLTIKGKRVENEDSVAPPSPPLTDLNKKENYSGNVNQKWAYINMWKYICPLGSCIFSIEDPENNMEQHQIKNQSNIIGWKREGCLIHRRALYLGQLNSGPLGMLGICRIAVWLRAAGTPSPVTVRGTVHRIPAALPRTAGSWGTVWPT